MQNTVWQIATLAKFVGSLLLALGHSTAAVSLRLPRNLLEVGVHPLHCQHLLRPPALQPRPHAYDSFLAASAFTNKWAVDVFRLRCAMHLYPVCGVNMPRRIPEVFDEWQEATCLADQSPPSQEQLLQTISAARRRTSKERQSNNWYSPQDSESARNMPILYSLMDHRNLQDYILLYPDFCNCSHPETMQNSLEGFAEGLCFLRALPQIVMSVKDQVSPEDRTKGSPAGSGGNNGLTVQFREWLNQGLNSKKDGRGTQDIGSRAEVGQSSQLRACIDMTLAASEVVMSDLVELRASVEGVR